MPLPFSEAPVRPLLWETDLDYCFLPRDPGVVPMHSCLASYSRLLPVLDEGRRGRKTSPICLHPGTPGWYPFADYVLTSLYLSKLLKGGAVLGSRDPPEAPYSPLSEDLEAVSDLKIAAEVVFIPFSKVNIPKQIWGREEMVPLDLEERISVGPLCN